LKRYPGSVATVWLSGRALADDEVTGRHFRITDRSHRQLATARIPVDSVTRLTEYKRSAERKSGATAEPYLTKQMARDAVLHELDRVLIRRKGHLERSQAVGEEKPRVPAR
jgi:hypothetical protein